MTLDNRNEPHFGYSIQRYDVDPNMSKNGLLAVQKFSEGTIGQSMPSMSQHILLSHCSHRQHETRPSARSDHA